MQVTTYTEISQISGNGDQASLIINFVVTNLLMPWYIIIISVTGSVYVNYDEDMVLTVTNLGLSGGAGQSYTYIVGSGDDTILYRYLE